MATVDDETPHESIRRKTDAVAARVLSHWLNRTKAGPQTQDRLEQSQHLTGVIYQAVTAIYSAMSGATVTVSRPGQRRVPAGTKAFKKALATAGFTNKDQDLVPVEPGHPAAQLFEHINERDTLADLIADWVIQESLTGNFFLWANPNIFGQPVELWGVPSALVQAQPGTGDYPDGYFRVNWFQAGGWGLVANRFPGITNIPAEQMHVSMFRNPLWKHDGYSPLTAGGVQLDLLEEIDISRKSAMEKGVTNGGVIAIAGASVSELERVSRDYHAKHAGAHNAGKTLFTGGDAVNAVTVGPAAKDMDYPSAWKDMTGFCLSLFNVPQSVIQSSNSNYAQLYASLRQFYTFNLQPRAHRYSQFLQKHLVRAHFGHDLVVQIDLPSLDDPELKQQMFTAAPSSAFTVNEYRNSHGFDDIDGGDVTAAEYDARVQAKVQKETAPPPMPGMMPGQLPPADGAPPQPDNPLGIGSKGPQLKSFSRLMKRELARLKGN